MRVVAIYHETTRKVLGYVDRAHIKSHTGGHRLKLPLIVAGGPSLSFNVAHDHKGNPIKVIASTQIEADMLMYALPCMLNYEARLRVWGRFIGDTLLYGSPQEGERKTFSGLGAR